MVQTSISSSQQKCISQCILMHWSEHSTTDPNQRDVKYEECLNACRICD